MHLLKLKKGQPDPEAIYQGGQRVTRAVLVSTLTVNNCLEPSPDLLRLSNAELGAVTSNLLVSLLQCGWGVQTSS